MAMFRIGILGSENSHAKAFTEIINQTCAEQYPDLRITAIYGADREKSKEIFERFDLEILAQKPEDMLGKVDAVMITARDGNLHPALARPFIEANIPAFIDKPFACRTNDALALARLAKQRGVPLCGGSGVKYAYDVLMMQNIVKAAKNANEPITGDVTAPLDMHNAYGGFSFYASHLAEMMLAVFGGDPVSVTASRNGDHVTAIVHYDEYDVTNHFLNGKRQYTLTLNRSERPVFMEVDISMIYRRECEVFAKMLRTGEMEQSYEALVLPVCCINAVERSYLTGTTCRIEKPVL